MLKHLQLFFYSPVAVFVNVSIDKDSPLPADVFADTIISYLVEGNTELVKVVTQMLPATATCSKSASFGDCGLKDRSYGLSITRYRTCVYEFDKRLFLIQLQRGSII